MKRNLLVLICSFFALQMGATHISQGDFYYRYIGDSTGIAHQYLVTLRLYRDPNGQSMPTNVPVVVKSSCYPSFNGQLPAYQSAIPAPSIFDCLPAGALVLPYEVYIYRGVITLPGTCSNFRITYNPSGNEYSMNIPGMVMGVFDIGIDNTVANNKSVQYPTAALRNFCVNKPFLWQLPNYEVEGDSVLYALIAVRDNNGNNLVYDTNYSPTSPLPAMPNHPVQLNQTNSALSVSSTLIGKFYIVVSATEYRYNNITQSHFYVGRTMRQFLVQFTAICDSTSQANTLNDIVSGQTMDTVLQKSYLAVPCFTDTLTLQFTQPIECGSISQNGSDFRLLKQNGQPIPIIGAFASCNIQLLTNEIKLVLFSPLNQNGNYNLYLKSGFDGNTISTLCGGFIQEYDTIQIRVSGCSGIGLSEQEVVHAPIIPTALRLGNAFSITIPETLAGNYQLSFYNLQGALLFTEAFHGSGNWVVQNAGAISKPGMYVCRLQSAIQSDRHWQQKVVVLP